MSVMAASVPLPPQNVQVSSSFAYAYGGPKCTSPSQPTVRRVIERFSEVAQLINVIISIKSQSQARNIFAPDPPRPLAVLDDEDARIAGWLVDLAQFYEKSGSQSNALGLGDLPSAESNGAVTISDSSRAFMVVSHAILALHQVLPYAPNSSTSFGSPMPLPTIESLRTALKALHVVSRSIQISAPNSRTRTQAVLLDAMPRILSLIDIFTNASLSSLDHFVMMTAQRDMVHELLGDLRRAVSSMGSHAMHARSLDSCCSTLEKASKGLRAVVDIGSQLQNQPSVQAHFAGYNTEQAPATNGISEETHTRSNAHALNHPGTFDHILNASFQASAHPHKPTVAPYSAPDDMSMASHLIHSPLSNRENGAGTMQPTSLHAYL